MFQNVFIYTKSCICIYLFPKIQYTGMYPVDVGLFNKLAL